MGFDFPWVLLLGIAIVPLLWVLKRSESFTKKLVHQFRSDPPAPAWFRLRYVFAVVFTGSLLVTGAGPYMEPQQTGDYLFLVDTSRSMQARLSCEHPTFLDRSKKVMQDVIAGVPEARFGIAVFDRFTFPITQLTYSHSYLDSVINNALFIGMTYRATDTDLINALKVVAGKKQTMPQLYKNVEHVILLSDGHLEDDDWRQQLEQPLKDLLEAGITLLVVGIGNAVDTPVPLTDQEDVCSDTMIVIDGKTIRIPFRSDILQVIASGSQGKYFEESETGKLIRYLREETLADITAEVQFSEEQRKSIGWIFLIPAAMALFGLFLL